MTPKKPSPPTRELAVTQAWLPAEGLRFAKDGAFELPFPESCPLKVLFYEFGPDSRVAPSYHDFLELMLVQEGSGHLFAEEESQTLGPGQLVLIGPGEFHRIAVPPRGRLRLAALHFRREAAYAPGAPELDFDYIRPFLLRGGAFRRVLKPEPSVFASLWDTVQQLAACTPETRLGLLAMRTHLLGLLFRVASLRPVPDTGTELIGNRLHQVARLRPAIERMRSRPQDRPDFSAMARSVHLSPSHFSRLFKRLTGVSPSAFLLRCRVDAAAALLADKSLPLVDIALHCGFCSQSHFSASFRSLKGCSPLAYRRHPAVASKARQ